MCHPRSPWPVLLAALVVALHGTASADTGAASAPAAPAVVAQAPARAASATAFVAPDGWTVSTRGDLTILQPPEAGSRIAFFEAQGGSAEQAIAAAWRTFYAAPSRTSVEVYTGIPGGGWDELTLHRFPIAAKDRQDIAVELRRANALWHVAIFDLALSVQRDRASQIGALRDSLHPAGYVRDNFSGRQARALDAARIADLEGFVRQAMDAGHIPGVAWGVIQGGRVLYADGLGVKALGQPGRPDSHTRFLAPASSKLVHALLLARLVEARHLSWDSPATDLLPGFRLANAASTQRVQIRHLSCSCTGLKGSPRWMLNFGHDTPASTVRKLSTLALGSGFGNQMPDDDPTELRAASGFLAGQLLHPSLEPGAAYDRTVAELVFDPLGMHDSRTDYEQARTGNAAQPHAQDADSHMVVAGHDLNRAVIPIRPSAGVWTSVDDMLRLLAMELRDGRLADGGPYLARETVLERRRPLARAAGDDDWATGLGMSIDTYHGATVLIAQGDMVGMNDEVLWLPEHDVGAVILTNGETGAKIADAFERKLLELLFDGHPEADAQARAQGRAFFERVAAYRRRMQIPAADDVARRLARRYGHPELGDLRVHRDGARTFFDFDTYSTEVASIREPDGTTLLVPIAPGADDGFQFVVGGSANQRTLTLRWKDRTYTLREH